MKQPEREVIIDHKTTILTKSTESDEKVRKDYLDKLNRRGAKEMYGSTMGRPLLLETKKS